MPGYIMSVPGGVASVYEKFQCTVHDSDHTTLWDRRWCYQMRGMKTSRQMVWTWIDGQAYWPAQTGFYSDPASYVGLLDHDSWSQGRSKYQPFSRVGFGTAFRKVIMGRAVNAVGVGVSGAVIDAFLTADDTKVSTTTADANGYYEIGTPNPGVAHYIVAYRAGSPDIAGTSVNTLIPNNRDGT